MLTGHNIIVLDLETAKSADDCLHCGEQEEGHFPVFMSAPDDCPGYEPITWGNKLALGLSIGCYYDYADSRLHWFDAQTIEDVVRWFVDRKPLLVSFNGIQFDFALMRAILRNRWESLNPLCDRFKLLCATSYDLLAEMRKVDPVKGKSLHTLDAVSQANGYGAKEMDGATAPRLWAQGRYADVLNYCASDVRKTRQLFAQIVETGQIRRGDGLPMTLRKPCLPAHNPTPALAHAGSTEGHAMRYADWHAMSQRGTSGEMVPEILRDWGRLLRDLLATCGAQTMTPAQQVTLLLLRVLEEQHQSP